MDKTDFSKELKSKTRKINELLERYLPAEEGYQKTVLEAMNYSVRVGGKRLRPMLMAETYRLVGGSEEDRVLLEPFMAALEMIHTYSLVHDDLPDMDNDTLRRGNPTTWAKFGAGMGILAGDGLLNYAFETALKAFFAKGTLTAEEYERIAKAARILAEKAGIYGMIGGQTADVLAEGMGNAVTGEMLLYIHRNKTAALIQAAMTIGAVLGGADEDYVKSLETCAEYVGIAFQIQDDILDVIGDTAELGKTVGSDENNEKTTYVTIYGLEKAKEDVERMTAEALAILRQGTNTNAFLEELLMQLVGRRK